MFLCTGIVLERRFFLGGLVWSDRFSSFHSLWMLGASEPCLVIVGCHLAVPRGKLTPVPSLWAPQSQGNPFRAQVWQLGVQCVPGADTAPGTGRSGFRTSFLKSLLRVTLQSSGGRCSFPEPSPLLRDSLWSEIPTSCVWGHWGSEQLINV